MSYFFFFFNDTATTEIYTLSLHDALPIFRRLREEERGEGEVDVGAVSVEAVASGKDQGDDGARDRKSTRLNSSHLVISYAVFCLKKKNKKRVSTQMVHGDDRQVVLLCVDI